MVGTGERRTEAAGGNQRDREGAGSAGAGGMSHSRDQGSDEETAKSHRRDGK